MTFRCLKCLNSYNEPELYISHFNRLCILDNDTTSCKFCNESYSTHQLEHHYTSCTAFCDLVILYQYFINTVISAKIYGNKLLQENSAFSWRLQQLEKEVNDYSLNIEKHINKILEKYKRFPEFYCASFDLESEIKKEQSKIYSPIPDIKYKIMENEDIMSKMLCEMKKRTVLINEIKEELDCLTHDSDKIKIYKGMFLLYEKDEIKWSMIDELYLKNNDKSKDSSSFLESGDYVYLLKVREFIKSDENIYKIGRTSKGCNKRMTQYPKGSMVFDIIKVIDAKICENEIKRIFNSKFKQRKDIGTEYYEGNVTDMRKELYRIVSRSSNKKIPNIPIVKKSK